MRLQGILRFLLREDIDQRRITPTVYGLLVMPEFDVEMILAFARLYHELVSTRLWRILSNAPIRAVHRSLLSWR